MSVHVSINLSARVPPSDTGSSRSSITNGTMSDSAGDNASDETSSGEEGMDSSHYHDSGDEQESDGSNENDREAGPQTKQTPDVARAAAAHLTSASVSKKTDPTSLSISSGITWRQKRPWTK